MKTFFCYNCNNFVQTWLYSLHKHFTNVLNTFQGTNTLTINLNVLKRMFLP